jgi:hypothetical protein
VWRGDFFSSQKCAITLIIRKVYHLYSAARMATRTRAGPHTYAAMLVWQILEAICIAIGKQCLLPYQWREESRWKVTLTVTKFMVVSTLILVRKCLKSTTFFRLIHNIYTHDFYL